MSNNKKLSAIETVKTTSQGLRGSIVDSLQDEITGAIREDDQAVIKFHGMYQQDDRDRRAERAEKKLDRLYTYMIRLRLPGGFLTADNWIAVNDIAGKNSTGIIKITTRQTIQLHGLVKAKIKPTIQSFNQAALDSIATCGDINRNVTCTAIPSQSPVHSQVFAYADKISELLKPKTRAYYELWLDEEKIIDKSIEEDALYQDRYLPRKFKIGIAIPPNNDIDVFTNDLGLIAIIDNNQLKGFNIVVGGGLSTTHGNAATYARLGTVIGFVDTEDKVLKTVYEVVTVQRDFGNRADRKLARLKYTLDTMGVPAFKAELEKRIGFLLDAPRQFNFDKRTDVYGWQQDFNGDWHYTLFVENGRVLDDEKVALKSALLALAQTKKCDFVFTANQNMMVSNVKTNDKNAIEQILSAYKIITHTNNTTNLRRNAMACVALPTCPLALAEAQRYMPALISLIEPLLAKHQLLNENITIRMTGCPNGCARPYAAEIGLVGTATGLYNLHIGGDNQGMRLNTLYKHSLNETNILIELDNLFQLFAAEKMAGETFGDFVIRKQLV